MSTAELARPTPSRSRRQPLVGLVAGVLFLTALSTLGDTPDTRDSDLRIATWFTQHRTSVFAAVFILTLAVSMLICFVGVVSRLLDGAARSIILCAGTMVGATVLLINGVIYSALAYVVGADSPSISRALFEITLVTTVVVGAQMAAIVLCTATIRTLPVWFRMISVAVSLPLITSGLTVAARGPFSPDVGQQVVWQIFILWLGASGIVLSRHSHACVGGRSVG